MTTANPLGSGDARFRTNRNLRLVPVTPGRLASRLLPMVRTCESSSEALNGYYGMAFLGAMLGDTHDRTRGF